ncbi:hypothetical protein Tco_0561894 [Tanacetum coccineum]
MAAVEVPQTLEYKGGQLNAAPILEVEIFTNWKNRFMCHISIEPQFENIISNDSYIPMVAGDQMNSVINCLTEKSTLDDLILYHEGPSDVKESRVMDLKLCYNTFKFKEEKTLVSATPLSTAFFSTSIVQDFQDSPGDEEDTRTLSVSSAKNKGLLAKTYDWDEDEVSSDDNEVTKVKALMPLTDEERVSVSKESARNSELIKISMKKVHTLLEMEDNDDRKSFLDYLYIDLNYVEEQRNNLMSKHRNLVQELNICKEQLLVLKQAKLDLLTM